MSPDFSHPSGARKEEDSTGSPSSGSRRGWWLPLLFLLGFTLVAGALVRRLPWPEEHVAGMKLDLLAAAESQYDVMAIGSSLIHHGFNPSVFDRRLEDLGLSVRSFNLGSLAMASAYEIDHVLSCLLDSGVPAPRYLLLTPYLFDPAIPERLAGTYRGAFWHLPGPTWTALRATLAYDLKPLERAGLFSEHLSAMLKRLSSYGLGKKAWSRLLGSSKGPAWVRSKMQERRGFKPLRVRPAPVLSGSAEQRESRIAWYRRIVEKNSRRRRRQLPVDHPGLPLLESQINRLREQGMEVILLIPPRVGNRAGWDEAGARRDLPAILDYDDPREYPELFAEPLRFDLVHLNRDGAELFSRKLAEDFAVLVKDRKVR